jgi:hypothetical protein
MQKGGGIAMASEAQGPKMVILTGLQGVGKTKLRQKIWPDASVVDYEYWWNYCEQKYPLMDFYEIATWVKVRAQTALQGAMEFDRLWVKQGYKEKPIVAECTGMTKVGQAAIAAMLSLASHRHMPVSIYYLKPKNWHEYIESISQDGGAMQMFREYSGGGPRWREPHLCPYLEDLVYVVYVDHATGDYEILTPVQVQQRLAGGDTV